MLLLGNDEEYEAIYVGNEELLGEAWRKGI